MTLFPQTKQSKGQASDLPSKVDGGAHLPALGSSRHLSSTSPSTGEKYPVQLRHKALASFSIFSIFLLGSLGCGQQEAPDPTRTPAPSPSPKPRPDPGICFTEADCSSFRTPSGNAALPPGNKGGAEPDGEGPVVWVVDRWFLGETDREGNVSQDAWKQYGFDLDGWASTPEQGFHCKPINNADYADIRIDGNGGVDNSFGKDCNNGVISSMVTSPSDHFTGDAKNGQFTSVFVLDGPGVSADYQSITSLYFLGRGIEPKVLNTAADWAHYRWHPVSNWSENGNDDVSFLGAYVANDTWVSGVVPRLPVNIGTLKSYLQLRIYQANVTITFNKERSEGQGTLGGIVRASELTSEFQEWLTLLLCDNNFFSKDAPKAIAESILQSADILLDGTQDPTKTCDGISVGLGFHVRRSALGAPTPLQLPSRECPP